jgi:hypothetical protein
LKVDDSYIIIFLNYDLEDSSPHKLFIEIELKDREKEKILLLIKELLSGGENRAVSIKTFAKKNVYFDFKK